MNQNQRIGEPSATLRPGCRVRAVVAVFVRAVLGWYRRHARRWGVSHGRGGAVVIVQRFGSALSLNVRVCGLDLHAAVAVRAGARDRLERLCRYALRPAVGQERFRVSPEGQVVLDLRRRWAAVVPSPTEDGTTARDASNACGRTGRVGRRPNRAWAALMVRSFGFDVLACPRCAGRMTLVALIRDAAVVGRILRHLGLPDAVPAPRAGRAPPLPWEADAVPEWPGVD